MAENVQITPGTGVTIGADSVTDITLGSAQIQYIKIMDGSIGGTNKAGVSVNGLLVDGSGVTQPISALSLPLPTGASTETTLSALNTKVTTTVNGIKVDGSAVTQPVSGTVTVSQPTAANLNATVVQSNAADLLTTAYLNDGSGNAISSTSGSLDVFVSNFPATVAVTQSTSPWVVSGSITTSPNVNIHDGAGNSISSTTGSLNVDVTNFPSVQPVSGTVAATQSGSWTVSLTSESIEIGTVDQGDPNTLANAWPVELSDGTNLLGTSSHPLRIDPTGTTTQPISGSVSVSNFPATQPVSGTVTALQGTSPWVISGSVSVSNASIAVTQSGVWSVGRTWTLASGTDSISAVQSGTWNITNISGTISLPTGAATSANQTNASQKTQIVDGSGNVIASTSNALNVDVTNFPATTAVTQSTSPWVVSLASTTITGTVTVAGNLTHNNAAPAANNVGVLPAVASSATPTYNTGDQVLLSTDLSGNLRVTIDSTSTEQNVNLNQVGGSAISIGQATMAASLPVVLASNQSSIPVTLASTTITGTVAVTQSTSPWVISGTVTTTPPANASTNITEWDSVALGAPSAYGTSPGAINVIGVNAFITNTPTVTANAGTGTFTVGQATGTNLHTVVDSGSITVANASIAVTQSTSPWVVSLASTTITGTVAVTQSTSPWVISSSDATPATQNVTVQDTGSVTSSGANSQPIYTGTPTAGSTANFAVGSQNSVEIQVTGTWTGTLQCEVSLDGGTTWYKSGGHQKGVAFNSSAFTSNFQVETNVAGFTNFRVRATAAMTGTATVKIVETVNEASIYVTNPIALVDGTGTSNQVAVTAANALKVDGSAVTQPVSGTVTANQGGAPWTQNLTEVGGVAVTAVTSKSTQPSSFIGMQAPKDSGRNYITLTADAIAGVTSETLVTFTLNKQGTTTTTQTNYTPTSGKTLRIQSITLSVQSGAGAGGWIRVKLRHNTAGATTTSSALVSIAETGTSNATALGTGLSVPIPDGLEIYGDGTQTIGITHISSATTNVESITVCGYEY